jgi:hypothetical protein
VRWPRLGTLPQGLGRRYGPAPMARKDAVIAQCLLALLLACACGASDADDDPAEALSRFLDTMDRSNSSETALSEAYVMLDGTAKQQLQARAQHAARVAGREFEPWQMLAQGRFRLRFAPAEHGGMHAKIEGDTATVRVVSDDKRSQVDVPMVREQGRWRVKLTIPEAHGPPADPANHP